MIPSRLLDTALSGSPAAAVMPKHYPACTLVVSDLWGSKVAFRNLGPPFANFRTLLYNSLPVQELQCCKVFIFCKFHLFSFVQCTLYIVHCPLFTVHFTIYYLHYTLYTVHSTHNTEHCTLYTVHFTLYTVLMACPQASGPAVRTFLDAFSCNFLRRSV